MVLKTADFLVMTVHGTRVHRTSHWIGAVVVVVVVRWYASV